MERLEVDVAQLIGDCAVCAGKLLRFIGNELDLWIFDVWILLFLHKHGRLPVGWRIRTRWNWVILWMEVGSWRRATFWLDSTRRKASCLRSSRIQTFANLHTLSCGAYNRRPQLISNKNLSPHRRTRISRFVFLFVKLKKFFRNRIVCITYAYVKIKSERK